MAGYLNRWLPDREEGSRRTFGDALQRRRAKTNWEIAQRCAVAMDGECRRGNCGILDCGIDCTGARITALLLT